MSYFPTDIPFMSEEELKENGIKINCSEIPNSSDYISRQAAIDAVFGRSHDIIKQRLKNLPSAQPERKKGKWSFIGDNMFECTCCGTPYTTQQLNGLRNYNTDPYAPKFCPNCGADMRGERNG